jgi:putative transposase
MTAPTPLLPGVYYHIFNRGNNHKNIFREAHDYAHFLHLYTKHVDPIAVTYAYCLLRNHLHLLIRTRTPLERAQYFQQHRASSDASAVEQAFQPVEPGRQLDALFNAYAKGSHQAYGQTGSLFQNPFGRLPLTSDAYFTRLVTYIHQNPQKHGLVADFRKWPYSSYHEYLSSRPASLPREELLAWFGGMPGLAAAHVIAVDGQSLPDLVGDDPDL